MDKNSKNKSNQKGKNNNTNTEAPKMPDSNY